MIQRFNQTKLMKLVEPVCEDFTHALSSWKFWHKVASYNITGGTFTETKMQMSLHALGGLARIWHLPVYTTLGCFPPENGVKMHSCQDLESCYTWVRFQHAVWVNAPSPSFPHCDLVWFPPSYPLPFASIHRKTACSAAIRWTFHRRRLQRCRKWHPSARRTQGINMEHGAG